MTSPPLNSHPLRAACPEATVMTVGVASPSAQGQAMTSTAIASCKARPKEDSALLPRVECKPWA